MVQRDHSKPANALWGSLFHLNHHHHLHRLWVSKKSKMILWWNLFDSQETTRYVFVPLRLLSITTIFRYLFILNILIVIFPEISQNSFYVLSPFFHNLRSKLVKFPIKLKPRIKQRKKRWFNSLIFFLSDFFPPFFHYLTRVNL